MGIKTHDINKAIDTINSGFTWTHTRQGHQYWSDVVQNLQTMLTEKRYCSECCRELD